MKNCRLVIGLFLILTAYFFTSCENEPIDSAINIDDFNNLPNGPAIFKSDFSGTTWTATSAEALISGNFISISGSKPNGEGFGFLVEANAVGTYPANSNLLAFTPSGTEFGYWSTNFNLPNENTGSITITNINTTNKTISGTFAFKGYWSDTSNTSILPVQFTNGVFQNIPYITQQQTGDTFFAKVGGVEFVDVDILSTLIDVNGQEFISIGAQNAALNSITVSVKSSLGVGTYPITGSIANDNVQAIYDYQDTNFLANSGSIKIDSKTATRIKGTFNFITNGATPFTVSEGAFDIEY